jgi:tRNA(Leu) C34 or U34 (ribose-2'-O)-methylase TrmL
MSAMIGLINPKFPHNVGAAIRAASCFGAKKVVYTGDRFGLEFLARLPREERMKGYSDVSWMQVPQNRIASRYSECTPVAIELVPGSENLATFEHPDNALYIFGPEDGSLPRGVRTACHRFVTIPSFHCTNLAAAIYITLYDRAVKRAALRLEELPSIDGESRGWWHSPSLENT